MSAGVWVAVLAINTAALAFNIYTETWWLVSVSTVGVLVSLLGLSKASQ